MKKIILIIMLFFVAIFTNAQKKQLLYATLASGFDTKTYWEIKDKPVCFKLHLDTIDARIWNAEPASKQFRYPKYPVIPMSYDNLFDLGKLTLADFEIESIIITVMIRGVYEPITIQTDGCVTNFGEILKPLENDQAEEGIDGKLFVNVIVKYKQTVRMDLNEIFIPMPLNKN